MEGGGDWSLQGFAEELHQEPGKVSGKGASGKGRRGGWYSGRIPLYGTATTRTLN